MAAMDIEADDDILQKVALDGSMNYSLWPALMPTVVSRIEKTARNDFPIPLFSPQTLARQPTPRFLNPLPSSDPVEPPDSSDTAPSSQETNKENATPSSTVPAPSHQPPLPASAVPSGLGFPASSVLPPGTLPPPIATLLDEITSAISENFQTYPPHTIQRLAELVLKPKQHYRNLPSYLHALDRVVHVTSGANVYPLPPAIPEATAMSRLANGLGGGGIHSGLSINSAAAANIGSDEALGGALLTPIPWLTRQANGDEGSSDVESSSPISAGASPVQAGHVGQQGQPAQPARQATGSGGNSSGSSSSSGDRQMATESTETIDGPNGMGRIETVSVSITNGVPTLSAVSRGITQGELLRQEQRAGVVPVSQLARHGHVGGATGQGSSSGPRSGQGQGHVAPNGGSSGAEPSDEDTAMNDEDPEQEVPHARGPEEIGAADMGPQNPNSTFHQAQGGSLEMQVIDVEAAVGRPGEGSHKSPEPSTGDDTRTSAEGAASRSPKREADEELEAGASKRVKDDAGEGETSPAGPGQEPERDAEGDVIIADPASESKAAADGEDGHDDAGSKESS